MASQRPGWYPDPNDQGAEMYWDGTRWHGRRQRTSAAVPGPQRPTIPSGKQPAWFYDRWVPFWHHIDDTRRVLIILGVIGAMALVGFVIAAQPWESKFKDECEAAALDDGYNPATPDFGEVVDFCIQYAEDFGHI